MTFLQGHGATHSNSMVTMKNTTTSTTCRAKIRKQWMQYFYSDTIIESHTPAVVLVFIYTVYNVTEYCN